MNINIKVLSVFNLFFLLFATSLLSMQIYAIPAFPGAQGFGADTPGGRGGEVIEVTSLADSGPGSLRAALDADLGASTPRTIVFRTGGTIEILDGLEINYPFVTIAGQTAPGDGITIKNHSSYNGPSVEVKTHDVVIRYLRVRPGLADNGPSRSGDGIVMADGIERDVYNIVIDHVSISWATDESISSWYGAHDITVQWSIFAEALKLELLSGFTGRGALFGYKNGEGGRISFHHNLMAHNQQRNPSFSTGDQGTDSVQLYNNVVYNWGDHGMMLNAQTFDGMQANVIGNYFKRGPDTTYTRYPMSLHARYVDIDGDGEKEFVGGHKADSIYLEDNLDIDSPVLPNSKTVPTPPNLSPGITPGTLEADWSIIGDGLDFIDYLRDQPSNEFQKSTPWPEADIPVSILPANQVYDVVLAAAGSKLPVRDSVDNRIIQEVENVQGQIPSLLSDIYGSNDPWPTLNPGTPRVDTDNDGMPDVWENKHNLDYEDPEDRNDDFNGDGYTNLEDYLNALASDTDLDGYSDAWDNCKNDFNPDQLDSDSDSVGDVCDAFPNDPAETVDTDGDGVGDNSDAFPNDPNETVDTDGDGVGDNSDAFPNDPTETTDTDGDGVGDNSDAFPNDPAETTDTDGDGVGDNSDAFPNDPNETVDTDGDGVGDNSDAFPNDPAETVDTDGDGVGNNSDNCPNEPNSNQEDTDGDNIGNVCDDTPNGDITLTGYPYREWFFKSFAQLSWTGAESSWVDVYRNGNLVATTENDGDYTYESGWFNPASGIYQVCQASSTILCSNEIDIID